jgi:hypothetical protein
MVYLGLWRESNGAMKSVLGEIDQICGWAPPGLQ